MTTETTRPEETEVQRGRRLVELTARTQAALDNLTAVLAESSARKDAIIQRLDRLILALQVTADRNGGH